MIAASEVTGFVASALVLITFAMKEILRATAILSNVAFIIYGSVNVLVPRARPARPAVAFEHLSAERYRVGAMQPPSSRRQGGSRDPDGHRSALACKCRAGATNGEVRKASGTSRSGHALYVG